MPPAARRSGSREGQLVRGCSWVTVRPDSVQPPTESRAPRPTGVSAPALCPWVLGLKGTVVQRGQKAIPTGSGSLSHLGWWPGVSQGSPLPPDPVSREWGW